MFSKSAAAVELAPTASHDAVAVPLSHLELDLPTPVEGWVGFLAARDIEVTLDDIGRLAVTRADAKRLLTEKREAEGRAREMAAARDRVAIEQDQRWRASLPHGVSASAIPAGSTFAEAALSVELDSVAYQPSTLAEDFFSRDEAIVYHAFPAQPDEE
jgi:hypothetical protein